ncbi:MAG TPA: GNAT family N-acetyltransferase [Ferruginibacter sp.]|nr:GNAT family N-acetyltransferase [Ferruginibacter sp.]HMP21969.1 GNAT family N-acetyltransferase [Ferruginibacter sp.]
MSFIIRAATGKDFDAIHVLIQEFASFIQTPEKVSNTPAQMLQDKDFFNCIVATDDEKIIGFATYFFAYYSWSGRATYLDDLYVTEMHRGKGVGTMLLKYVIQIAKENNCRKVKWQVSKWNTKAISFYKKLGASTDAIEMNVELAL